MPLFELAACVAAVFTAFKCCSYCISSCNHDDNESRHGHIHRNSSTNYGSITTQPTHRPLPSPTNTRDTYIRSDSLVSARPISGHDSSVSSPIWVHPSRHARPSCLPGVPPNTLIDTTLHVHPVRAEVTPAPQPSSSRDLQLARARSRKRGGNLRAPLASLTNLESDGGNAVEGLTTAKSLREQASRKKREMDKALELATRAQRDGNHRASERHNRDASKHERAMNSLNQAAAKIIFKEKNKDHIQGTVDLHDLTVKEALEYATQEFQEAALRDKKVVHFIVGKGKHSKGGKAKIRPALEELCDQRGYPHSLHPTNGGVLIVQC